MTTIKTGELFCGVGGLGLGFLLADHPNVRFAPMFALDLDASAVEGYGRNIGWLLDNASEVFVESPPLPLVIQEDIEKLDTQALLKAKKLQPGELDLLLGGPPCQGFSTSNRQSKRESKADRNRLVKVFLDRLQDIQPKMFLLENVQGVRWTEPTRDMVEDAGQQSLFPDIPAQASSVSEYVSSRADRIGYYLWHGYLDAVEFGVPQRRTRYFAFGVRKDLVESGEDVKLDEFLPRMKEDGWVSVREAIGDLPELGNGQRILEGVYTPGNNQYVRRMRRFMQDDKLYDHVTTKHFDIIIERFKLIPEGGNWQNAREHMGKTYSTTNNTHSNIYRRLRYKKPAHTISHYRKSMTIHPEQDRGLSFREACRLQSFPDWFRFVGELDHRQQQLANAVPPLMASAVAWAIAEFLDKKKGEQPVVSREAALSTD